MRSLFASCLVTLVVVAAAAPSKFTAHKLKESIPSPGNWVKTAPAPKDLTIELRIALPQPNFAELERHLYEVSDPVHERYGQHLSKEEVEVLSAPHPDSIQTVDEWITHHGVPADAVVRSSAKDWVRVTVPISLAEEMLNTEYHVYTHVDHGDTIIRTTSYSLPEHLHEHIDLVQPTTLFSTLRGMKTSFHFEDDAQAEAVDNTNALPIKIPSASGGHVDASCNRTITITCLQQIYNAVGYKPSADSGNEIGITGYLEEFANKADLQSFYADQRRDALGSSFKFISVKHGLNNQSIDEAGAEANLDVQFAFGLAHPIPGTFYSTAGRPPFKPSVGTPTDTNEPYTDWLQYMLSHRNAPQTISTSYADEEQTVPRSFALRACNEFAMLGARGISLIFSSGDGGVGDGYPDPATSRCLTNDGRNRTQFLPLFPPSCPFVTSVGGTAFVPETAAFFSGGGFSNLFPLPDYQRVVVEKYLKALAPGTYAGLFNPQGRAVPDVAAQSLRFRVFLSGVPRSIGGTSAASPTFAGIVALLNDARIANKQRPLGFLNPLLYHIDAKYDKAFNDITTGSNPGCGTPGFNATKGWDPVTGLGTPNFGELKKIVTSLGRH
ncbi:tripeptidyl peptidase A [Panus rudis PR-1116 ss-1]|nr:tripeptidyl peptidase A [Panus rudis PR-1116 ss-1]